MLEVCSATIKQSFYKTGKWYRLLISLNIIFTHTTIQRFLYNNEKEMVSTTENIRIPWLGDHSSIYVNVWHHMKMKMAFRYEKYYAPWYVKTA